MQGTDTPPKPSRKSRILLKLKRKLLGKYLKFTRIALLSALVFGIIAIIFLIKSLLAGTSIAKYTNLARVFVFTPKSSVQQLDNKTNILILGRAGEGSSAPDLTDTIILVSFSHNDPQSLTLISLPRDIWIEGLRSKINGVYFWGNKKEPNGGGLVLAKATVEEILGIPVHYAAVIDFSGFTKIIDAIGGVDVDIERSFVDKKFPIPGLENDECGGDPEFTCRYEVLEFTKGAMHMNGKVALKFVRSRQSEDLAEGTDLARAKRQQLVLDAIKDKALSRDVITSPSKIISLFNLSNEIIQTDLSSESQAFLARKAWDSRGSISSNVIPEEFLINPPISKKYDNLYVFIPNNDSWEEIREWARGLLR